MIPHRKLIAFAITLASLSSCATNTPSESVRYDASRSRAYNLAQAAGISDARDIERSHLSDNELYKMASNTDLLMWDKGANWSAGEALGASVLFAAMEPTSNFAKDSLFGWMPSGEAENAIQARRKMSEVAVSAIKQSLEEAGHNYEATLEHYDQKAIFGGGSAFLFNQITIVDDAIGCPPPDSVEHYSATCYVSAKIIEPVLAETPEFIGPGKAYAFGTNGVKESAIEIITPEGIELDRHSIIAGVSEILPRWAYIFQAARENVPPVVMENGDVLYFIEPVAAAVE